MSTKRLDIAVTLGFTDFTLTVDQSFLLDGCTAIFGPSGSGKSTLLRLIAGFSKPDSGRIIHNGQTWCDTDRNEFVPPHKRSVGAMFQDARLFPHLTAGQNLLYADRRQPKKSAQYGYTEIIDALDLSPLTGRMPATLSGGERQRVALGRTLLAQPDLLLLDEPLAALDRQRKRDIIPYLERLPDQFGIPTLLVSHDIGEVARLADRVLILENGSGTAFGDAVPVLNNLTLGESEQRFTMPSILEGRVRAHDTSMALTEIGVGDGSIFLPLDTTHDIDASVRLKIDPTNVAIAITPPQGISIRNVLPATITAIDSIEGTAFFEVLMAVGSMTMRAHITRAALGELELKPEHHIFALVKSASFDV